MPKAIKKCKHVFEREESTAAGETAVEVCYTCGLIWGCS